MPPIDPTDVFWDCDHDGSPPSARAFEEAVTKALTEAQHCTRPLRVGCSGDHLHSPHWHYAPCGTRFADRCEPCSIRYGKQVRALIHSGLREHADRPALAFTLTAPSAETFGTVGRDFDHMKAALWNYSLRDGIHLFTQRLARAVLRDDPEGPRPGYLIIIEFQRRGLAHVHGIVFGAKAKHILEAAHGERAAKGKRRVVVTTRAEHRGRLVTKTRESRRLGWSVARTTEHIDVEHADRFWSRYAELCFTFASDAATEFEQELLERERAGLPTGLTASTSLDWRWGEQVQIEQFRGAETGRARGRWARYLSKYISKSVGHGPTADDGERDHHRAMASAAALLPCHVHDRYQCGCAKFQAMASQYGVRCNVLVRSRNWGCTLSAVRRARSRKKARECTWAVLGAGYSKTIVDEVHRRIAASERKADRRRAHHSTVPATVGPAAP